MQHYLRTYGLTYEISHRLARGLDYYTRTTFEVRSSTLGAQNALLGGGRYDGLVKLLGGADRVGIGFAAGIERLVLALPSGATEPRVADTFVVAIGDAVRDAAVVLARDLRWAGLTVQIDYEGRTAKSQMKRAGRLGALTVVIIGSDELARNEVTIKDMTTGDQRSVRRDQVVGELRRHRTKD